MSKLGQVEINWQTPDSGPPRKWYTITEIGKQALNKYAEDILKRKENFEFFLNQYNRG